MTEVGLVGDFEIRHVLLDRFVHVLRRYAESSDVVARAVFQAALVGMEQVERGLQAVGHVHHRQHRVFGQEAFEFAVLDGIVINLYRIVGSAAARQGFAGNDTGITYSTDIHAVFEVVVGTYQFAADLGHPVHRGGLEHGVLRRHVSRRGRTERGHRAGCENPLDAFFAGYVVDGGRAAHVDVPSQRRVLFAYGRQNGGQVEDSVDFVLVNQFGQPFAVQYIQLFDRTAVFDLVGDPFEVQVRGNHIFTSVNLTQGTGQFGTDLAERTR